MRYPSYFMALALCFHVAVAAAEESHGAPELYDRGIAHYKVGEFEAAIVDFKAAYALEPSGVLLFNLAQAHRQLGDGKRALFFYRAFVRESAPSPARTDAERMVAVLEGQGPHAATGPPSLARMTPALVTAPPAPREGLTRRGAIAIVASTAAIGTALVLTGVGLTVHAAQITDSLEAVPTRTQWDSSSRSRYDAGRASGDAAIALYALGGVSIAASVITAIVYRDRLTHRERRVAAGPRGLSWAF